MTPVAGGGVHLISHYIGTNAKAMLGKVIGTKNTRSNKVLS